jgi:L-ascorbate metabolism protein UlaG (beta-lactamase superfamily)
MATELTWLGHGSWAIRTGDTALLVDPFLDDNPAAPVKAGDVLADFILVSHGHFDHLPDAAAIAQRTGAQIISNFEITEWFRIKHDIENLMAMNLGGGAPLPFGHVKMTLAHHSSGLPDGSYGGTAAGFVLTFPEGKVYFACDTALFGDMRLIGRQGIDLAILPIGDLFTMGPDDSIEAIKLVGPKRVAPAHYNTWPPIVQDADQWAQRVQNETTAEPVVVAPGETITL